MNLLIDIGNTNLRWALQGQHGLGEVQVVRHGGAVPIDLLAAWEGLHPPERALISNVGGPAVGAAVVRVVRSYWGREAELAATRADAFGVRIAYAEPERLGVDRWLALIAARRLGSRHWLIVDAGTAVTYDLLLADGQHLGGLILPGIETMRESLLARTAIPRVEADPSGDPWATDTGAAVAAGSLQALSALAERLYDRLAGRCRCAPDLLLTGGDGPRLAPAIGRPLTQMPDLVLLGLARLAEEAPT